MARGYSVRPEPIEDLEQVARLGLVQSVDRYDPGLGSFTTPAAFTICGAIKHHFRNRTRSVHASQRLQNLSRAATAELSHA